MKKIILGIMIILFALLIASCAKDNTKNNTATDTTGNAALNNQDEFVKIPLSDLSDKVQFYNLEDRGVTIMYFAVLGSDGKPRVAFVACDVCGGYKGYEQQGNDIRCKNCGKVFSIDGLGTKNKGYGCWPSYLPQKIEGDNLLIKISDIKDGRSRFA